MVEPSLVEIGWFRRVTQRRGGLVRTEGGATEGGVRTVRRPRPGPGTRVPGVRTRNVELFAFDGPPTVGCGNAANRIRTTRHPDPGTVLCPGCVHRERGVMQSEDLLSSARSLAGSKKRQERRSRGALRRFPRTRVPDASFLSARPRTIAARHQHRVIEVKHDRRVVGAVVAAVGEFAARAVLGGHGAKS